MPQFDALMPEKGPTMLLLQSCYTSSRLFFFGIRLAGGKVY
jgi:hypothetical protein